MDQESQNPFLFKMQKRCSSDSLYSRSNKLCLAGAKMLASALTSLQQLETLDLQ